MGIVSGLAGVCDFYPNRTTIIILGGKMVSAQITLLIASSKTHSTAYFGKMVAWGGWGGVCVRGSRGGRSGGGHPMACFVPSNTPENC